MRTPFELFLQLQKSKFRRKFHLESEEQAYLQRKTMSVVLEHGREFLMQRLAPAAPTNDGNQTPMKGHPIFIAQHATGCCCRRCLEKWHDIPQGRPLTEQEVDYLLDILSRWLELQMNDSFDPNLPEVAPGDDHWWLFDPFSVEKPKK
ncbi:MAG: DUF4186 domain-containing protein [Planctomycetia bacterium]|jgi:hypothetical protein